MTLYILGACLFISVITNLFFVWYTRNLLKFLAFTNEDSKIVLSSLSNFQNHLESVYGMDLFYGDSTLESLLKHTKEITEQIDTFVSATDELIMEEAELIMEEADD